MPMYKNKWLNGRVLFFSFLVGILILAGLPPLADAFSIRAVFKNDNQFFSVLFDGSVASSTAGTSTVTLNAGSPQVFSLFPSIDNPLMLFGQAASGTLNIGDTLTASSSIKDISANPNQTTSSQVLLPAVSIAAARSGLGSNNQDEFLMLYNNMNVPYVASGTLYLHSLSGASDRVVPLTFATSSIPDHGFFLISSGLGYSGSIPPDAFYSTSTDMFATSSATIYINTTSTSRVNIIDKLEWGASASITTSTNATSSFANSVATTTLPNGYVLVRKAGSVSTAASMASGGGDANKGNGYNTRSNSSDFVLLNPSQTPIIKNSFSPKEFPFGGGQNDTVAPIVMGSFPSGTNGEMVPTDLRFIGFGFNKPVDPTTIGTSTVSLVVQGQSANLCASVTYSNMNNSGPPGQCNISGALTAGTTYVFTVNGSSTTPNVKDFSSNPLNQPAGSGMGQHGNANRDYQITFSPQSGFSMTPQVPPSVIGTFPLPGSGSVPTNIAKVSVTFSQTMSSSSFGGVTLVPAAGGSNLLLNAGAALSADGFSVFIPLSSNLATSASYLLTVPSSVQNSNGIFMPGPSVFRFTAGSGSTDLLSGPQVIGKLPNIASGVPVNAVDIHAVTDQALDASSITSSTVQITDPLGNVLPGILSYNPMGNEIVWVGNNVFQTNTQYTATLNASGMTPVINNVAGLALQDTDGTSDQKYQFLFTTAASPDTTQPGIMFANANTFSLAVTFDEPVKKAEAENIANYALTSGGSPVSISSFNGNTAVYDATHKTVTINNLSLTSAASFTVSVSGIHDLSGNLIDPTKANFSGTVQASTQNGGSIGVGGGYVPPANLNVPTGFSSSQFSFVPQPEVRPFNTLAGLVSTYSINLPVSKQIPATIGKIVLTFPSSFTLAGAAADSFSPANNDINGPGAGTVTIGGVSGNDTAHTVTVTLGGVPTQNNSGDMHDFLHFDLAGIVNSTLPNNTGGYTVDIRTLNGTTTLESFTSMPFFITSGGSDTLTVSFSAAGATAGTANAYIFSPQTGPIASTTTAFANGAATTTFSNLPDGTYSLMTDPIINLTGGSFVGQSSPLPLSVAGNTSKTITFTAAGSLGSSTVSIFATAAGKKISVFAGGPTGYVDVPTSTVNGTTTATIYFPADGDYMVGVGPQINKTFMGPPPSPDYVMPRPVQVHVASGLASLATVNFSLVSAGKSIAGFVQDSSGKIVTNANVHAYSPQGGFGTFSQSGSDGSFRLNVSQGSYKLGADAPGFPSSQEISVIVDASGNLLINGSNSTSTSVTLKLNKPSTSISGSVTDGTNPVQGAQVWAYCSLLIPNNPCLGPSGHAEAQTDSLGTYTLYVGNGTWSVAAFIPGYGQQPGKSVVVSGSSATNQNFQPSDPSTSSVFGTICTNTGADCSGGVGISGAIIRIEGTDPTGRFYTNSVISRSDGTYSLLNVPSGVNFSYKIRAFVPSLGDVPPTASFGVARNIVKNLVLSAGRVVNVNVNNSPASFDVFMKLTNTSNGASNFISLHNNASGTVQLPKGAAYKIDLSSPGFNLGGANLSNTGGSNVTYSASTGILDMTSVVSNDTVTLALTLPTSTLISGTVKDDAANLVGGAWVDISNPTNGLHFGAQANASGTYAIAVQDGSYGIGAFASGYVPSSKSLVLSNGTTTLSTATTTANAVNITLIKSAINISGTVTINGASVSGALVRGLLQGGGTSITLANSDGTYNLPVSPGSWSVSAVADGFQGGSYAGNPVVIGGSSVTGVNINLTTSISLASPTALPITPSQGGTLRNSSGNLQVSVPANALGSSANTGQIKATETNNLVRTSTVKPIGNGQDIKAYDSSNNSISTLNSNVTISMDVANSTFSANSINSTTTAAKLKLGYFDSSLYDWVPVPSTVSYLDANGVQVTPNATLSNVDHINLSASVSHFSVFGPIVPTDALAPAAPTGVTATPTSANSVTITWTAPTTNSDGTPLTDLQEFEIYRDTDLSGNFAAQVNTSQVASGTTSFVDNNAALGVGYYYKVTAADTSGNESSKSGASAKAQTTLSSTGGGGSVSVSSGGGGGGGGGSPAPVSTAVTASTTAAAAGGVTVGSLPTSAAQAIKVKLTRTLVLGSSHSEVTILQQLLSQDPTVYPEKKVTGYFGRATLKAVKRFQVKYKVAKPGEQGYGSVGPKTRKKLLEIFGSAVPGSTSSVSPAPAGPVSSTTQLTDEQVRAKILELQNKLNNLLNQLKSAKQ